MFLNEYISKVSVDEKLLTSKPWMNKNILFAPDYVINAGGLINVANEIEGYDESKVKKDTEKI